MAGALSKKYNRPSITRWVGAHPGAKITETWELHTLLFFRSDNNNKITAAYTIPAGRRRNIQNTNLYVPKYVTVMYTHRPNDLFNFLLFNYLTQYVLNEIIHNKQLN